MIQIEREKLEQVLEALESALSDDQPYIVRCKQTVETLRTRLAQPEPKPEPVSWGVQEGANLHDVFLFKDEADEMCHLKGTHAKAVPLYTAPPKKEWVSLTDDEYQAIRYGYDENGEPNVEYELFDEGEYGMEVNIYVDDFARAIEAKLKEKNAA
jgi:hypothetical protein